MTKVVIRHVVPEDLEVIVSIMNEIILTTVAIYDYDTRDKKWIEDWYNEKK